MWNKFLVWAKEGFKFRFADNSTIVTPVVDLTDRSLNSANAFFSACKNNTCCKRVNVVQPIRENLFRI